MMRHVADITVMEALARVRRGEGYLVIRNPCPVGKRAIEFVEVENSE